MLEKLLGLLGSTESGLVDGQGQGMFICGNEEVTDGRYASEGALCLTN